MSACSCAFRSPLPSRHSRRQTLESTVGIRDATGNSKVMKHRRLMKQMGDKIYRNRNQAQCRIECGTEWVQPSSSSIPGSLGRWQRPRGHSLPAASAAFEMNEKEENYRHEFALRLCADNVYMSAL
jgi:hypothetical protein